MLILTRKVGQRIFIGDKKNSKEIEIKYMEKAGSNSIVIGIKAPDDKIILREEVYDRVQANKQNYEKEKSFQ